MMCCYYPTTTVAIDDDVNFLKTITQQVGIADCITYSSPNKAIEFLKDQKSFQRIQSRILKTTFIPEDSFSMPENHAFTINMRGLHEEIYSKNRFKDISVIIVDYYMDNVSGIDVCEALSNHAAKKILLTGGIDKEKIAIEAFNKGIIHRFINKSDPNFPSLLKHAVSVLKDNYFSDLNSTLLPYFSFENSNLLQNPAYINLIKNLKDQFNLVEYFLLDANGSCIFLDKNANPTWLVVKHESEIKNYATIAEEQDIDRDFIKPIKTCKKIPFFFLDEDFQQAVSEWDKFLYPSNPFPGLPGYYYSIIEGHIRNNLQQDKIIPYASLKNTMSHA